MHAMTFEIIYFFQLGQIIQADFPPTVTKSVLGRCDVGLSLPSLSAWVCLSVFSFSASFLCVLQFLVSGYDLQLCHRHIAVIYATAHWFVHNSTCVNHYHNRMVICSLHSSATAQVTLSHDSCVEITQSAICQRALFRSREHAQCHIGHQQNMCFFMHIRCVFYAYTLCFLFYFWLITFSQLIRNAQSISG